MTADPYDIAANGAEFPEGWADATVADLILDAQSGFASGRKDVEGGLPHLRMNNIGEEGHLVLDLIRTVPSDLARPQHELERGDVLVCTTNSGKLVGKCALFDLAGKFAFSNHLTRLRPNSLLMNPSLLRWGLWLTWRSGTYEEACRNWVNQSTLPKEALLASQLPLPPLAEQKRIVAKVEALLARVNAARERLAKAPALLKRFRQSVLAAACSGQLTADWRDAQPSLEPASETLRRLGGASGDLRTDMDLCDLPGSWSWTDVRTLIPRGEAFCYGVVQPGADDPAGVPLVRAGDLTHGTVDISGLRRIPHEVDAAYSRSRLRGGEVLVTVVGAGIGEAAVAPAECAGFNIARAVAKLPIRHFSAQYILHWLQTSTARMWMDADAREVARPTLNLQQLQTLPIPLPPVAEQQEIVRRVEALFALADKIEARVQAAAARVEKITQAILAKAFRGELVPTEAELARQEGRDYEPASVLLERIRAARAAGETTNRKRTKRSR